MNIPARMDPPPVTGDFPTPLCHGGPSMNQTHKHKALKSADHPPTLTPRQVQILRLIRDHRASHGCSPTMQELAERLCVNKVTVFEHVEALVQKKLLHRVPNKARSLTLDPAINLPEEPVSETVSDTVRGGRYPLMGRIVAGAPLESFETPEMLDVGALFDSRRTVFALQVQGDSMIDEQIRPGDYVLVEKTDQAHNGQIVVALLDDGQTTLKKFFHEGRHCKLAPANPRYSPILTDRADIQGVVVGLLRKI
jgi:repressor LexA